MAFIIFFLGGLLGNQILEETTLVKNEVQSLRMSNVIVSNYSLGWVYLDWLCLAKLTMLLHYFTKAQTTVSKLVVWKANGNLLQGSVNGFKIAPPSSSRGSTSCKLPDHSVIDTSLVKNSGGGEWKD